jgi:osmotically-inducible protein OsmY
MRVRELRAELRPYLARTMKRCLALKELHMVTKKTAAALLIATIAAAGVGCSSSPENGEGGAEQTAANAGRAVDDSVITAKVKSALIADPTTKAHQIEVETFKGQVQLSGFVDGAEAKERAAQVAKDIEGVKGVKNSLQVRSDG